MNVIDVSGLSKVYRLYSSPKDRLRELVSLKRRKYHHEFFALRDVSLKVPKGQTVGIVGQNGSGKSTLLKIICGVTCATSGHVNVVGRVSSLLELGAGFHPEFSGRDNVYMNGALMGLDRNEIDRHFPEIEAFADIGGFIDQPVKSYSSGMYVRLAFAAAVHVEPDILVIDESLAVGDIQFQHKCMARLAEFRRSNRTILFVSHNLSTVKALCSDAIYLNHGSIVEAGRAGPVVDRYIAEMAVVEQRTSGQVPGQVRSQSSPDGAVSRTYDRASVEEFEKKKFTSRLGSEAVRVRFAELCDESGKSVSAIEFGQTVELKILVQAAVSCPKLTVAFYVKDRARIEVIGTNSDYEGCETSDIESGELLLYQFRFQALMKQGPYTITLILAAGTDGSEYYDWIEGALLLDVICPDKKRFALYSPPVEASVTRSSAKTAEM